MGCHASNWKSQTIFKPLHWVLFEDWVPKKIDGWSSCFHIVPTKNIFQPAKWHHFRAVCFAHGIRHPLGFTCCARAWLYLTITPALKKIWPHFRTKTRRIAHPASRASQQGETWHESGRKRGVYCVYSTSSLIFSSHCKCYPLEICCIAIEKDNLLWVFLLKIEIFHG